MQILENFKHAETFAQMTLGDKMVATLYVILLGMGITFVALVTIWAITALMSKILMGLEGKSQPAVKAVDVAKAPVAEAAPKEDEGELVAVITAAIAASLGTSMHNIIVTNIRRVEDATPTWGRAGRSDVMNSRF